MILFKSKYRRRIEIAKLKATIKLREIEYEKSLYKEFKQPSQWCDCIVRAGNMQDTIDLLDKLLKGEEIRF